MLKVDSEVNKVLEKKAVSLTSKIVEGENVNLSRKDLAILLLNLSNRIEKMIKAIKIPLWVVAGSILSGVLGYLINLFL